MIRFALLCLVLCAGCDGDGRIRGLEPPKVRVSRNPQTGEREIQGMCPQTGYMILELGSLSEMVQHNPTTENRQRLSEVYSALQKHLQQCDACREGLKQWESGQ